MLSIEEMKKRFQYHAPDQAKIDVHQSVRQGCALLGNVFNAGLPDSREKSLAMTSLEEAMMWANAAIARNPLPAGNGEEKQP